MSRDIPVAHIVRPDLLQCGPTVSLVEAASRMREARCSSVVVTVEGRPVGIWTERDALELNFADLASFDLPIASVMSSPVRTIIGRTSTREVGVRFKEEGLRHYLVVDDDGMVLGMVSQTDIILNQGIEHFLYLRDVNAAMSGLFVTVPAKATLNEAVARMRSAASDAALVQDNGTLGPGIITERDLVRLIAERRTVETVGEVASRPLVTVSAATTLLFARDLLTKEGIRHVGVVDGRGQVVGLLSFSDILQSIQYEYLHQLESMLKERREALELSERHLNLAQKVIEATPDGVMIVTPEGIIEEVNPAFTRVTGYSAEEAVGRKPSLLSSGRHDQAFYRGLWDSLHATGYWQGEIWNRRKGGEIYAEWLTISVIRDADGAIHRYAATFSDITARKEAEEHVRNLAYYDTLTGLPNRSLFNDRLLMAIANAHRHGERLAVMFLDLDGFKPVNDTFGHLMGDKVLQEVGSRLAGCVREGDSVARQGGDEFTVLLPDVARREDALALAERILDHVVEPLSIEGRRIELTASIGIAIYPDDGAVADVLLQRADQAMYRVKREGRNGCRLFSP